MRHDCERTSEGFPDLLFGEAEPSARVALLEEVARCERCAREYRTLAETLQVFDHAADATLPAEGFWPGYGERLRMRIEQEIRPNFWGQGAGIGEYRLTFVEDEGLVRRLLREVKSVAHDAELSWPEFRRDPFGFVARSVTAYGRASARFFSQRDVALATLTSVFAISILVVSVFALERYRSAHGLASANPYENLQFVGYVEKDIPKDEPKPDGEAAGLNKGKGGGSKQKYEAAHGGGGGGRREELEASRGKLPTAQLEVPPIVTPNPHPPAVTQPHLPTPATIQLDPLLANNDPRPIPYGDPRASATVPSSGTGRGGGIGDGSGGGVGTGNGTGYGPGSGYNTGGGPAVEGGGGHGGGPGGERVDYGRNFKPNEVTARAVIISKPEPGFTEEARTQNVTGTVRLRAVLSASGEVTGISIVKGLPAGLTEKAISAARQIKFRPATKDGHTVSQYVTLEYNFNIY
ncbi:MAG TPA: energy transducer TonB [Pyrinomonadaceae bacterium]|jgi:TonB family protein|nr:energy transducer TonB [Pyrinomonadaceae bacterium]